MWDAATAGVASACWTTEVETVLRVGHPLGSGSKAAALGFAGGIDDPGHRGQGWGAAMGCWEQGG